MNVKICFIMLIYTYLYSDVFGKDNVPNLSSRMDQQNEKVMQQQLPLPAYYNEERKPCKYKAGFHEKDWVNVYKRRMIIPSSRRSTHPLNTDLLPRSLKDGDYQDSTNDELKRSGNDPELDYTPNPLINVFVDRNEDSISQYHENELRRVLNQESVLDLCKNYKNKLTLAETDQNVDQKTSNNKLLFGANKNVSIKSQVSKSAKSVNFPLSPENIQTLKNCVTAEPKTTKENVIFEQSRRFLQNTGDDQDINFSLQNSNEMLSYSERLNNEPNQSLNNHDSVEKPSHDLNVNNERDEILDPTKGPGITRLSDAKLLLSGSSRVCYACTSANNPSCWVPDRRTTVKYCRKGHSACVTKMFTANGSKILIRDCASSCDAAEAGITPKYKSCVICHSDLCNDTNSANSINSQSLIVCIIVISFIRDTF